MAMSSETFDALLAPNLTALRRLVKSRVRPDQADDIVQQTLLLAFANRTQLRAYDKFKYWLCTIALNQVRMLHRRARPCISIDDFPNFEFADQGPSPLAVCEQRDVIQRLRAGMARLNERDRTAIRLVDLKGLTESEAADELAVSKAAFKSTHFRARKRLAQKLGRAA
jgi:RNA polymerase sigma-70 factor (ECF subfamily)